MQWTTIQLLVRILLQNFDYIILCEDNLLSILDKHVPIISNQYETYGYMYNWSITCTKTFPGIGYTCGLWYLFHIMSIGVVE